jgi:hypothetical protein
MPAGIRTPNPGPDNRTPSFRATPAESRALRWLARESDYTQSDLIRYLILQALIRAPVHCPRDLRDACAREFAALTRRS